MIRYTTGNLLDSDSQCLVNTVNCEGYMGKGLAYQFKKAYPENNKAYVKACKSGLVKVGKVFFFEEDGKIIANFPTKDKWRNPSKIEYIQSGLIDLKNQIKDKKISSLSIPPLGSGNGGLNWNIVKSEIENSLKDLKDFIDIIIYEPSNTINTNIIPKVAPKLSLSNYILSKLKSKLNNYHLLDDKQLLRIQKTCYFFNFFYKKKYFKFEKYLYGPYSYSIDILNKKTLEFMVFYNIKNYELVSDEIYKIIINKKIDYDFDNIENAINLSTSYVNNITSNKNLECLTTIMLLIDELDCNSEDKIIQGFKNWSHTKSKTFPEEKILEGINYLEKTNIIYYDLLNNIYLNQ